MSLAWEEMHCLQCRLSLQPIWILELQFKYLFVVFCLESGSWAASQTPVDRQPFLFSLSQTKAFGYIAACLIYHQSAQDNEHDCSCKVFKAPNICCSTCVVFFGCYSQPADSGLPWIPLMGNICWNQGSGGGSHGDVHTGLSLRALLWNGQMQEFLVEILKYCEPTELVFTWVNAGELWEEFGLQHWHNLWEKSSKWTFALNWADSAGSVFSPSGSPEHIPIPAQVNPHCHVCIPESHPGWAALKGWDTLSCLKGWDTFPTPVDPAVNICHFLTPCTLQSVLVP